MTEEEMKNESSIEEEVQETENEEVSTPEEETESDTIAGEEAENSDKESKKEKKKKDKSDKKLEALNQRIEELEDLTKRQMAEFENFRKRTEKEKSAMFDMGVKSLLEKILPVVDNFERGLAMVAENQAEEPFVQGMDKIYKQLMAELDKAGVKPIEAKGKEFDPNFHNAVMQVESDELESGYVAEELLKGYTYNETVVRHSMVSVVQ